MTSVNDDFGEQLAALARTASHLANAGLGQSIQDVLGNFAAEGLLGAIADEDVGGLGLPIDFASAIVGAAASELLADPILEALIGARLTAEIDPEISASIAGGASVATLTLHETLVATKRLDRFSISGAIRNVLWGEQANYLLAPVSVVGVKRLALLDLNARGVERKPAETLDLERSRAHIIFSDVRVSTRWISEQPAAFESFRKASLGLYSQWLASQADACLRKTAEYLVSRRQFGRALASFQALRFSLAQCAVDLENLRLLIRAANAAFEGTQSLPAEMAYAHAAEVCPKIVEKCLHLNGGMGFTWEVPIHRYLRRTLTLTDDQTAASVRDRVSTLVLKDVVVVGA